MPGPWRYAALAVLCVAAVVSATGTGQATTTGTKRAVAPELRSRRCEPSLLIQEQSGLVTEIDPETRLGSPLDPWTNPTPLDITISDYAPDGTLYAIARAQPSSRSRAGSPWTSIGR